MKRIKSLLVLLTIVVVLPFTTACGMEASLGASMMMPDETEEVLTETDEYDESEEIDEDDEEIDEDDEEYGDYDEEDEEVVQPEEEQTVDDRVVTVILNTNKSRKRIHLENKSCSNKIGADNKLKWTGTADELIEFAKKNGYVACGSCHPDNALNIDLPTK